MLGEFSASATGENFYTNLHQQLTQSNLSFIEEQSDEGKRKVRKDSINGGSDTQFVSF